MGSLGIGKKSTITVKGDSDILNEGKLHPVI